MTEKKKNTKDNKLRDTVQSLKSRVKELEKGHTGREQTRRALCESLELYQTLVETSPDAIILSDVKGAVIMVNEQTLRLVGEMSVAGVIGKNVRQLVIPSERKRVAETLRLTLAQNGARNEEYTLSRTDRGVRRVEVNTAVINNANDEPEGILAIMRDISRRKEAEDALRDRELLYRTVTEGALSGVYIVRDDKFTYVNPALAEMFGYSQEDIVGQKSPIDLTHSDDRQLVTEMLEKRYAGKTESVRYTFRGIHQDGKVIYCESLGRLIHLNRMPVIIGTLLDVTKREQVLQELRHRGRFESLIAGLATRFINLNSNEVDAAISDALREIGEFADVDRSYIFQFTDESATMSNTHEWCASGIQPFQDKLQQIPLKQYSWLIERMRRNETVYVADPEQLPAQAASLKKEMEREKITSLMLVPMECRQDQIGFIGFDAVHREKSWPDYVQALLRITGAMFANVLERKRMDTDIELLNRELLQTNMKLKQLALRDSHTGLYNHRYFEEAIEAEFIRAQRQLSPLSVIMIDIDYFKSINDVYGHQFGDLVLKQLAKQLLQMVRKYDTVIRYGGEEFIIITPGAARDIALVLARRLLDVVKLSKFGNKRHRVKLKLSMAVASFPEDKIMRGMDFIKIVDDILNRVKESGGDRVYSAIDVRKRPRSTDDGGADVKVMREKLNKLTRRANQSLAEAIFAFAKTIEIKDHYTGEHVEKTVHYATEIARALNLSPDEVEHIRQAAILHDLGKIGISEKILMKESSLTPDEYEEIKNHPQIGVDILRPIHFFHTILPFILHHHERWDGNGYPYGMVGEETPLGARIIAIADTYDAITSDRRYRKACSQGVAMQRIKENAGTQFDPKLVEVFLALMADELDADREDGAA